MHDAGYDGGFVFDLINGGLVDTRSNRGSTIDNRFYNDLITLCNRQIGGTPLWHAAVLQHRRHLLRRRSGRRLGALRCQPRRRRTAIVRHPTQQLTTNEYEAPLVERRLVASA